MSAAYLRALGNALPKYVPLPGCDGKPQHASEAAARRAVSHARLPGKPFRCASCRGWHIGPAKWVR